MCVCSYSMLDWKKNQPYVLHIHISICSKCGPRLSSEAAEKLKNRYVLMRNGAGEYERETGKKITIPITVRYAYMCTDWKNVPVTTFLQDFKICFLLVTDN